MISLRGRKVGWVLAALLPLAGVAVLVARLVSAPGDRADPPSQTPTTTAPEAQPPDEFLAAYERSRRATWLLEFSFTRRLSNGARLDLRTKELNRPPDHLTVGVGGRNGRVGGRQVACDEVAGREVCAPGPAATGFEEELAAQLGELRDVLQPPAKWYAVEAAAPRTVAGERARCFALRRIVAVPAPPYGERAEYCFAPDGVPLLDRIERREGTDERVAVTVRRKVTDADLATLLRGETPG